MAIYINQSGTAKRMDGAGDGSLYAPVTSIATPENGSTASKAYAVGEMFIRDGKLCTCTVAISSGGSFAKGTNYVEGSVGEVLKELNSNYGSLNNIIAKTARTESFGISNGKSSGSITVLANTCGFVSLINAGSATHKETLVYYFASSSIFCTIDIKQGYSHTESGLTMTFTADSTGTKIGTLLYFNM